MSSAVGEAPLVFLFAGQGCQHFDMGKALRASEPFFEHWLRWLDAHAERVVGRSVLRALARTDASSEELDELEITHPAIFMIEYATAQLLCSKGVRPDIVVGVSLGEYAAAAVAGALHPLVALDAVIANAASITRACPEGGMLAIVGLPDDELAQLPDGCSLALLNGTGHRVVAGDHAALDQVARRADEAGAVHVRMPVRRAFHNPVLDRARGQFLEAVASIAAAAPSRCRIFSPATVSSVEVVSGEHLWRATRDTLRVADTIAMLQRTVAPRAYVDLSPSGTLAGTVRRSLANESAAQVYSVFSPFGGEPARVSQICGALS